MLPLTIDPVCAHCTSNRLRIWYCTTCELLCCEDCAHRENHDDHTWKLVKQTMTDESSPGLSPGSADSLASQSMQNAVCSRRVYPVELQEFLNKLNEDLKDLRGAMMRDELKFEAELFSIVLSLLHNAKAKKRQRDGTVSLPVRRNEANGDMSGIGLSNLENQPVNDKEISDWHLDKEICIGQQNKAELVERSAEESAPRSPQTAEHVASQEQEQGRRSELASGSSELDSILKDGTVLKEILRRITDLRKRFFVAFNRNHRLKPTDDRFADSSDSYHKLSALVQSNEHKPIDKEQGTQTDVLWIAKSRIVNQHVIANGSDLRLVEDRHKDGPYYHGVAENSKYIYLLDKHNKFIKRYDKVPVDESSVNRPFKLLNPGFLLYDGSKWKEISSLRLLRFRRQKVLATLVDGKTLLLLNLNGQELACVQLRTESAKFKFGPICECSGRLFASFSGERTVYEVDVSRVLPDAAKSSCGSGSGSASQSGASSNDNSNSNLVSSTELSNSFRFFACDRKTRQFVFTFRNEVVIYKLMSRRSKDTTSEWPFQRMMLFPNDLGLSDPHCCLLSGNLALVQYDYTKVCAFQLCGLTPHCLGLLNEDGRLRITDWLLRRMPAKRTDGVNSEFRFWDGRFSFCLLVLDNSKRGSDFNGDTLFLAEYN